MQACRPSAGRSPRAPTIRRRGRGRTRRRSFSRACAHSVSRSRGHLGRVGCDQQYGRAPAVAAASTIALASARREVVAALLDHGEIADSRERIWRCCWPGPDRPSAPPPLPAPASRSTASSVSSSVAAAMSAAACSPTVAASRVFAWPATGALAITTKRHGYHEIARQKSSPAWILPRSDPLTFDLPPVRGP